MHPNLSQNCRDAAGPPSYFDYSRMMVGDGHLRVIKSACNAACPCIQTPISHGTAALHQPPHAQCPCCTPAAARTHHLRPKARSPTCNASMAAGDMLATTSPSRDVASQQIAQQPWAGIASHCAIAWTECGPECSCSASSKCCTSRCGSGVHVQLRVQKGRKGWALHAMDALPAGCCVCMYGGEYLQSTEADRRLAAYDSKRVGHALLVRCHSFHASLLLCWRACAP